MNTDTVYSKEIMFKMSNAYSHYVLGLLIVSGVCSWVDRSIFSILLQSIKLDFSFSDTQLGLLGGVAFGLFYATVGFPIARLADQHSRRNLLSVALALWSIMTTVSGMATGFLTLFLTRIGVGIGEAGGTPPSHSLISDYFPPERRGFAMGILSSYIPLGFLVSFLLGGWINQLLGWRKAFFVVGIPGILVALLIRMTLREPPRGLSEKVLDPGKTPSVLSTIRHFWNRPAMRHIPLAGAIQGIGAWAMSVWLPAYFMRIYGMSSGEVGTWMALIYGIGGGMGALCGGYLADRLVRKTGDQRWYMWGSGLTILVFVPFSFFIFLSSTATQSLLLLIIPIISMHMYLGPVVAMMQGLAGLRRRAVAAAFYLFLTNLISMGVGPVLVGMISDYFGRQYGSASLRYALLSIVVVTFPWAAAHFFAAARTLREDLAYAQNDRGQL